MSGNEKDRQAVDCGPSGPRNRYAPQYESLTFKDVSFIFVTDFQVMPCTRLLRRELVRIRHVHPGAHALPARARLVDTYLASGEYRCGLTGHVIHRVVREGG